LPLALRQPDAETQTAEAEEADRAVVAGTSCGSLDHHRRPRWLAQSEALDSAFEQPGIDRAYAKRWLDFLVMAVPLFLPAKPLWKAFRDLLGGAAPESTHPGQGTEVPRER